MNSIVPPRCLTRIVADDVALDVAQIQNVIARIHVALHDIPDSQRGYIANALLDLAVTRMARDTRSSTPSARRPSVQ